MVVSWCGVDDADADESNDTGTRLNNELDSCSFVVVTVAGAAIEAVEEEQEEEEEDEEPDEVKKEEKTMENLANALPTRLMKPVGGPPGRPRNVVSVN